MITKLITLLVETQRCTDCGRTKPRCTSFKTGYNVCRKCVGIRNSGRILSHLKN